ncbi:hypothetical protein ACK33Q_20310, partial [Aeromonas veronii]
NTMMGYRQQKPKIGLTKCPDLVDHYNHHPLPLSLGGLEGGTVYEDSDRSQPYYSLAGTS